MNNPHEHVNKVSARFDTPITEKMREAGIKEHGEWMMDDCYCEYTMHDRIYRAMKAAQ